MAKQLAQSDFFIQKVFTKYLGASIFGLLATTVSGLIDTAMVGRFLGSDGLSAMSLVNPIYLIYYTIGAVIGMGGSTAANFQIGRNNIEEYQKIFSFSFWLLVLLSVVITALGLVFLEPLSRAFGASARVQDYVQSYLGPYIMGGAFTLLVYIPLNFLKVEGFPQLTSGLFILSSVVNAALTALFLSPVFNMGMKGASIATVISMGLTTVMGFILLIKKGKNIKLVSPFMTFERLRKIVVAGSPNGLNNLFTAGKVIILNSIVIGIGCSFALPCLAVTKSISDLVFSIISGVALAMVPIAGVFYGEKDNGGIRIVFKKTLLTSMWITVGISVIVFCFPTFFCSLFNLKDPDLLLTCNEALRCLAVGFLFSTLNIAYTWLFNATYRSWLSDLILAMRLLVFTALTALVLSKAIGLKGVWYSAIASEILTLVVGFIVILILRKRDADLDGYLLNTKDEGNKEKVFSVRNNMDDIMNASNAMSEVCEEFDVPMKKATLSSLVLEEMLTVIITYCMDSGTESFIDIRVKLIGDEIMIRIRNTGKIFDPVSFYNEHLNDPEYFERILGLKMIIKSAQLIEFRETFGVNNLLVMF